MAVRVFYVRRNGESQKPSCKVKWISGTRAASKRV